MKVCKNCGQLNTNDCDFCCNCGKKDFVVREEILCSHCGAANDKAFAFCINCGNRLGETSVDDSFVPSPADVRRQFSDVYGETSPAIPGETAKCPNCGALIPIYSLYCSNCGASVSALHEHRVVVRKVCPHCGLPNSPEAYFCSYCFSSLDKAVTEEMQVVHSERNSDGGAVRQVFLQDGDGKKKICSNCGALNAADEIFCSGCGYKLEVEPQKKYCPKCGAENAFDDLFCTECQWSFAGNIPEMSDKWVCSKCKNINSSSNEFCVACGAKKKGAKGGKNV